MRAAPRAAYELQAPSTLTQAGEGLVNSRPRPSSAENPRAERRASRDSQMSRSLCGTISARQARSRGTILRWRARSPFPVSSAVGEGQATRSRPTRRRARRANRAIRTPGRRPRCASEQRAHPAFGPTAKLEPPRAGITPPVGPISSALKGSQPGVGAKNPAARTDHSSSDFARSCRTSCGLDSGPRKSSARESPLAQTTAMPTATTKRYRVRSRRW